MTDHSLPPLIDQLTALSERVAHDHRELAAAADAFIERLHEAKASAGAPQIGSTFPPFLLPSTAGELVSLTSVLGHGPVIVAFLRGPWCPFCATHAKAFSDADDALRDANAQLVIITPSRAPYAAQLAQADDNTIVLCDMANAFAASLGLIAFMDEDFAALIRAFGSDLSVDQGHDAWSVPIPATFVLNADGVVVDQMIDPNYRTRMSLDAVMAAVHAAAS